MQLRTDWPPATGWTFGHSAACGQNRTHNREVSTARNISSPYGQMSQERDCSARNRQIGEPAERCTEDETRFKLSRAAFSFSRRFHCKGSRLPQVMAGRLTVGDLASESNPQKRFPFTSTPSCEAIPIRAPPPHPINAIYVNAVNRYIAGYHQPASTLRSSLRQYIHV
jgi:hypothetical protein